MVVLVSLVWFVLDKSYSLVFTSVRNAGRFDDPNRPDNCSRRRRSRASSSSSLKSGSLPGQPRHRTYAVHEVDRYPPPPEGSVKYSCSDIVVFSRNLWYTSSHPLVAAL